jgi:hypothetical protein
MSNHIEQYNQRCRDIIARVGYMIQGVGAGGDGQCYAYTIGRELQSKPDFVMVGIVSQDMINAVVKVFDANLIEMVNEFQSKPFTLINYTVTVDGEKQQSRFQLKKVKNVEIVVSNLTFGMINPRLGMIKPVGIYQIIYADKNNLLLDEEGYGEISVDQLDLTDMTLI